MKVGSRVLVVSDPSGDADALVGTLVAFSRNYDNDHECLLEIPDFDGHDGLGMADRAVDRKPNKWWVPVDHLKLIEADTVNETLQRYENL